MRSCFDLLAHVDVADHTPRIVHAGVREADVVGSLLLGERRHTAGYLEMLVGIIDQVLQIDRRIRIQRGLGFMRSSDSRIVRVGEELGCDLGGIHLKTGIGGRSRCLGSGCLSSAVPRQPAPQRRGPPARKPRAPWSSDDQHQELVHFCTSLLFKIHSVMHLHCTIFDQLRTSSSAPHLLLSCTSSGETVCNAWHPASRRGCAYRFLRVL